MDITKLKKAAIVCQGWHWVDRKRDENGTHHFGRRTEDGEFYEMGTVDVSTYTGNYVDDLRVLKFIRLAQPETVVKLIAEIDRLQHALSAERAVADRYRHIRDTPGTMDLDVWQALEGADAVDVHGKLDQALYGAELDRAIDKAIEVRSKNAEAA